VNSLLGAGLVKFGGGSLALPNNDPGYAGPTTVLDGTLQVGAAGSLGASGSDDTFVNGGATLAVTRAVTVGAALTLADGATLQLANGATWAGPVALGGNATIAIPSGSAAITGDISGVDLAGLVVSGSLTLSGFDTYNGLTDLTEPGSGTLRVLGILGNSEVRVGSDTVAATLDGGLQTVLLSLHAFTGGTVIGAGETVSDSVVFDRGSAFDVTLSATSPPSALVVSSGPVILGGTLNLAVTKGFRPAAGAQFTLLENDTGSAIAGTFANWADGSIQTIGGIQFQISYEGGANGQSVVLTVL
jgi:fibronectin-binding autotransporter adhesin